MTILCNSRNRYLLCSPNLVKFIFPLNLGYMVFAIVKFFTFSNFFDDHTIRGWIIIWDGFQINKNIETTWISENWQRNIIDLRINDKIRFCHNGSERWNTHGQKSSKHNFLFLFYFFFTWNALLNTGQTMEVLVVITVNSWLHFIFR